MKRACKQQFILPVYLGFIVAASFNTCLHAETTFGVTRLNDLKGQVSFLPGGEKTWVDAERNRPLIPGDRLWNEENSFSSLQSANAITCTGSNSLVSLLNVNEFIVQLQLISGTLEFYVGNNKNEQEYEISTPNLVFYVYEPGHYQIRVSPETDSTTIHVLEGTGEIYGENSAYHIGPNQGIQFFGTNLKKFKAVKANSKNELSHWCANQLPESNNSVNNVSPDVIGNQDLNYYGSWTQIEGLGMVWSPKGVEPDWAPYQEGHWLWIEPWGWTWIAHEPWGFAPYHYGRWAQVSDRWFWVPGPKSDKAFYAPALVGFVLMDKNSVIGWFPLAPGELFWPSYYVSFDEFNDLNSYNTLASKDVIKDTYDNPGKEFKYLHQNNVHNIIALTTDAFSDALLASKYKIPVTKDLLESGFVSNVAEVTPNEVSILGAKRGTTNIPPNELLSRSSLILTPVVALSVPMKAKSELLAKDPGRGLESDAYKSLQEKSGETLPFLLIKQSKPTKQVDSLLGAQAESSLEENRARLAAQRAREARERERLERQMREEERRRIEAREERRFREEMHRRELERRERYLREEARRRHDAHEEKRYQDELRRREHARQERQRQDEQRRRHEAAQAKALEKKRQDDAQAKAKAYEDAKIKAADEKAKAYEDAKIKAADERARAQEEAKLKAAEEKTKDQEAKQRAAEENAKAQEEAKLRAAEENAKAQEEAKLRAAEEKARAQEEAKQRAAEENAKAQEEAKQRAAEEKARAQEEAKQRAAEEKARAQKEAKQRAAEEKARAQEEAKQRAAEEKARAQEEEARMRAEQEKAKAIEEEKRKAEEALQKQLKDQQDADKKAPPPPP
ncbi:MAG: hypothetical protein HYX61_13685 [Gammaproteobacteria bacterium]|jgi:hypothetical protein|nr:hypothetical protein [Gammaproteobacteria bacterium]